MVMSVELSADLRKTMIDLHSAGNGVTLKAVHKQLRSLTIRIQTTLCKLVEGVTTLPSYLLDESTYCHP